MELPFDYIVLSMFNIQKVHNVKTEIDKKTIVKYLIKLVKKLDLNEFISSFDFDIEMDFFVQNYSDYIEYDGNSIVLDSDVSLNELNELINVESKEHSKEQISSYYNIINSDLDLFTSLGIKIRKELYEYLLYNEKKLEDSYEKFNNNDLYDIKKYHLINSVMFFNMSNLLSDRDYENLYLYSSDITDLYLNPNNFNLPLLIDSDYIYSIYNNTFDRAILLIDDNYEFILRDKIFVNMNKNIDSFDDTSKCQLKFYLTFLEFLDNEIETTSNKDIKRELIVSRNRLMNALGSIFDINAFNNKENINIDKEDYSFIGNQIFYFIEELFKYDDYKYLDGDKEDYIIYFYNIIKKIYIDTYYNLTNDDKVLDIINNNKLDNSEITLNILSGIGKKKIKKL